MSLTRIFLILMLPLLCRCSVYESSGRKFLESNAGTPSWIGATANLQSCAHEASVKTEWTPVSEQENVQIYESQLEKLSLRISPLNEPTFNCYFHFASEEELTQKTSAAIDMTFYQLGL